jgi:hypothetical protein
MEVQLTEQTSTDEIQESQETSLRAELDRLQRESHEIRQQAAHRIIEAEMKVEALRAGIVDLDGLKFLDLTQVLLEDNGGVAGGVELISQLKRAKPWLFGAPSSSSVARVPPSKPARPKLATEMTDDEYRVARANIIRRSAL